MPIDATEPSTATRSKPNGYRVLMVSTGFDLGGAEQQILRICRLFIARGHEVRIVSLTPLGPMGHQANAENILCESLDMTPGIPDPRAIWRLAKIVRRWRPDIVHGHMMHANLLTRAAKLFCRMPVLINTSHNEFEGGRGLEIVLGATDRLADCVTHVCRAGMERYIRIKAASAERSVYTPNGIVTSQYAANETSRSRIREELQLEDRFAWLAVGRFEEAKDYPNLLRAFRELVNADQKSVLLLVGRGSLHGQMEAMCKELRLEDFVRFLGPRSDVPALMSAVDGYVMSSAWEGMPLVLQEAAAASLPIVATAVGGNAEVVIDRKTGILAPPRDPEALTNAMIKVTRMPIDQRRQYGAAGYAHTVAMFDLEKVVDRWESIYRSTAQNRQNAKERTGGYVAGEAL